MHCFLVSLSFRDTILSKLEKFLKEEGLSEPKKTDSYCAILVFQQVPWEFQGGCIDGLDSGTTGYASLKGVKLGYFSNQIKILPKVSKVHNTSQNWFGNAALLLDTMPNTCYIIMLAQVNNHDFFDLLYQNVYTAAQGLLLPDQKQQEERRGEEKL